MDSTAANFTVPLDIEQIQKIIPHRYPFLLVDRVVDLTDTSIIAIKNLTANEPFFEGYFPEKKVMPGGLQLEAMAQTGAVWVLAKPEFRGKIALLVGVKEAKFRRPVVPGDQLRVEVDILSWKGDRCKIQAKAYVEKNLAAEATLFCLMVDRDRANNTGK